MPTIAELVVEPAVTIQPGTSLESSLVRLLESQATELFVTDEEGRLLGIVPDYELLKAHVSGRWAESTIQELMCSRVLCVTPDTPQSELLRAFREAQHARAAVLLQGRLLGQITRRTLLKALRPASASTSAIAPPKFLQAVRSSVTPA